MTAIRNMVYNCAAALVVTAATLTTALHAPAQAQEYPEIATFVGHFNFDALKDTVYSEDRMDSWFLPTRIAWGRDTAVSAATSETVIRYPNWKGQKGSVAFLKLNDDTLHDIVLFIRGTDTSGNNRRDTARRIALFGQSRLFGRNQINVNSIARNQTSPFFAIDLAEGTHLVEGRVRDLSGKKSHRLSYLSLNVRDTSGSPGPQPMQATSQSASEWFKIYPNPSVYSTTVEAGHLQPGVYTLALIASNGTQVLYRRIDVGRDGSLFTAISLDDVASGYYELQINRHDGPLRNFPLIVLH